MQHDMDTGSAKCSVEGQIVKILGFVGHMVIVQTTQLDHYRTKSKSRPVCK